MTHTFLERSELVPVVITCVVRENKEIDNKTTSVRVFTSNTSYDEILKKAKIASLFTGGLHKILTVVFKS